MIFDASRWQLEPTPWAGQAACKGCDPDLWFPERGNGTREAKAICHTCPVETACRDYALRWAIEYGVWGGTTPDQRRTIRAHTHPGRPRLLPAPHGTTRRYAQNCRCRECQNANQAYAESRRLYGADA